ncbi:hypothetical protein ABKS89_21265 [Pseudomonas sp. LABIM340]|uniref:Uncharacterized protein n=1 Tax=Pseudomonas nitroreducens TaxID=46680 RepID=A0A5R8ZTU1_PSENT|nr:hypothetical protein [Pseudomonas nitroreducens]TLP69772.1 hypothetical protein FEA48_28395 [Pseudomonas nitroreducens]
MSLSLIGLIACATACWRACRHDDEQAALLPFADDPDAARRMSAATGRHCERVVQPLPEPPPPYRMRA